MVHLSEIWQAVSWNLTIILYTHYVDEGIQLASLEYFCITSHFRLWINVGGTYYWKFCISPVWHCYSFGLQIRRSNIPFIFLQSHNDALDDHRRIPMVEYQKEYRKLETRYCVTHSRYKYGMGCEKCYRVFCVECVAEAGSCKNGKMQKRPIILQKYDSTMYWALSNLSFVLIPLRCDSVMCQFLGNPMSGKKICWAITMEPVYLKYYVNISFFSKCNVNKNVKDYK